jgi:hypothetical protein
MLVSATLLPVCDGFLRQAASKPTPYSYQAWPEIRHAHADHDVAFEAADLLNFWSHSPRSTITACERTAVPQWVCCAASRWAVAERGASAPKAEPNGKISGCRMISGFSVEGFPSPMLGAAWRSGQSLLLRSLRHIPKPPHPFRHIGTLRIGLRYSGTPSRTCASQP